MPGPRVLRAVRASLMLTTALLLPLAACSDTTGDDGDDLDAAAILSNESSNIIYDTYVDLNAKAGALVTATATLSATPNDANLTAAQNAWRATRVPWERSEGFLFGPVESAGIDPSIDSWPVNRIDLDAVLAGDAVLTKTYIDGLEGTLKGFHTIEYLLFGTGSKTAAQLTDRELEYLEAVTASLKGATQQLADAWDPAQGNYVAKLANAGNGSSVYASQSAAVQELINGMIGICDEVSTGKISEPYTQHDRTLEESQFSNNSNADFADNIRSVRNLYLGSLDGTDGDGITVIVHASDAALDATVRAKITAAITAIGNMTPTFGEAITDNTAAVDAAIAAVADLQETIQQDVLPLAQGN